MEPMAIHHVFYLQNYFSTLPIRYLCVLLAIKQASNKFISSFLRKFCFLPTHNIDSFLLSLYFISVTL